MAQAAAMTSIHVTPNPGGFGARVTGVDLTHPVDAGVMADIRRAWLAHRIVFFPDQPLSLDDLERFTLNMGSWGRTDFIKPLEGHPNVLELRREADETSSNFGAGWHSDYSFQAEPPSATLLFSKVTPPLGGDTLFADMYAAYDDLSDAMKRMLAPLSAVHSAALPYAKEGFYANEGKARSMTILPSDEAKKTQIHPVVRTHPETGRKCLYINRIYTIGIEGMTRDEGEALIGFLTKHSTQEKYVYRHKWRENMLTMWDNRCVQHYADGGYDGYLRLMYRTTTAGDRPR